jgi:hypothetical protein
MVQIVQKLYASQTLRDRVKDCRIQLAKLATKLKLQTGQIVMHRFGIGGLIWPFRSHEVDTIMKKLRNCRYNISFIFQDDQAYVHRPYLNTIEVDSFVFRVQFLSIYQEAVLHISESDESIIPLPQPWHDQGHESSCPTCVWCGSHPRLTEDFPGWLIPEDAGIAAFRTASDRGCLRCRIIIQCWMKLGTNARFMHSAHGTQLQRAIVEDTSMIQRWELFHLADRNGLTPLVL